MTFQPTYLYIKQHSITEKLYFGKTEYKNIDEYNGSGLKWSRHIKKHGKEHVETLWYCLFNTEDSIKEFAIMCSIQWDIVISDLWSNMKNEDGLDGGSDKGRKSPKQSKFMTGNTYNKGKKNGPQSPEAKAKQIAAQTGKTCEATSKRLIGNQYCLGKTWTIAKTICPHCGFEGAGGSMKRWHFDNCKLNLKH